MTSTRFTDLLNNLFVSREGQPPDRMLRDFLSFTPTAHVVETQSGARFFTRCALDALLAAWILDENLEIETLPPGATSPLRLTIRHGQLHAPEGAVLTFPERPDTGTAGEIHETFCPYVNVFPDEQAHQTWTSISPVPTTTIRLQDAFSVSQDLVDRLAYLSVLEEHGGGCC